MVAGNLNPVLRMLPRNCAQVHVHIGPEELAETLHRNGTILQTRENFGEIVDPQRKHERHDSGGKLWKDRSASFQLQKVFGQFCIIPTASFDDTTVRRVAANRS